MNYNQYLRSIRIMQRLDGAYVGFVIVRENDSAKIVEVTPPKDTVSVVRESVSMGLVDLTPFLDTFSNAD